MSSQTDKRPLLDHNSPVQLKAEEKCPKVYIINIYENTVDAAAGRGFDTLRGEKYFNRDRTVAFKPSTAEGTAMRRDDLTIYSALEAIRLGAYKVIYFEGKYFIRKTLVETSDQPIMSAAERQMIAVSEVSTQLLELLTSTSRVDFDSGKDHNKIIAIVRDIIIEDATPEDINAYQRRLEERLNEERVRTNFQLRQGAFLPRGNTTPGSLLSRTSSPLRARSPLRESVPAAGALPRPGSPLRGLSPLRTLLPLPGAQ
ncbi:Hypothetical protein POVN_LOCUS81 [uncultured virus]|nr:Hypothetical protein POVN_LOCUS81 [uncultured virus]